MALLILWPLLSPGFILTLDMVFTPKLDMPAAVTSSYLFRAGLHLINLVVPGDIIEKIILFAILVLSGLGIHRLMRSLRLPDTPAVATEWASYASGLLYTINPFTYSRFMAGQYSVLLGYACLPFFIVALLRFIKEPSLRKSLVLAMWVIVISIVSIHTLGLAFVIALITLLQAAWRYRANNDHLKQLAKYGAIASSVFIIISSYWLLPLVQGSGTTAASIATFRGNDQSEFSTGGDGVGGKIMHVLRLQGFWAERNDLYLLPQDALSIWGIAVTLVWALVVFGAVTVWRQKREVGVLLTSITTVAVLLAAGVGATWLADNIPFFAGYREPQKFAALVALSYAVFAGFAISKLTVMIRPKVGKLIFGVLLSFIIIGFTPVMFNGFNGQLTPRQYPADWYAVNNQLNNDHDTYQVLSLPWHLYMRYQFSGRVIANPGDGFFDKPILVSDNPEIGNVKPAVYIAQKELLTTQILPQAHRYDTLGHKLAPLNVKYIILSKDDDYRTYDYLNRQTDLQLITDSETLKLYRNTAFKKGSE